MFFSCLASLPVFTLASASHEAAVPMIQPLSPTPPLLKPTASAAPVMRATHTMSDAGDTALLAAAKPMPYSSPFSVSTDIVEDAVDRALKAALKKRSRLDYDSGVVERITNAVKKDVADKVLTSAGPSVYGDGVPPNLVGFAPAPTPHDIRQLQKKAMEARKVTQKLERDAEEHPRYPKNCTGCLKYWKHVKATTLLPEAKKAEREAEAWLTKAEKWAALESRRVQELPALVESLQQQARLEYERRSAAERRALQVKIERLVIERLAAAHVNGVRQAVAKQRLKDLQRAREDARQAERAIIAAREARRRLKLQKEALKAVARLKVAVEKRTKDAVEKTSKMLANQTNHVIGKVVTEAIAGVKREAKQEESVEALRQSAKFLHKRAADSAKSAKVAKAAAKLDQERVEAAIQQLHALADQTAKDVNCTNSSKGEGK